MKYEFLIESYASELLKVLSVWSEFSDEDLTVRPNQTDSRGRSVREQMVHQCVSEDLWFRNMLGIDVHDVGAYYYGKESRALEPGVVMTVEPGIYVAPDTKDIPEQYLGIGVRIEDDVLCTSNGPRVLTTGVPKDADEIEALMKK